MESDAAAENVLYSGIIIWREIWTRSREKSI